MPLLTSLATMVDQPMAFGGPHDWGNPPFPFFVFPVLLLVLLGVIAALLALSTRRRSRADGRRAGERVVAERYAAGEIGEAEFRTRRAVLREKR